MARKIFLTGFPGCGKTTIIQKVLQSIKIPSIGFYTEEMRKSGLRTGFLIKTLDGKEAVLASIDIKSEYKVSKYKVNTEGLEQIALPSIKSKTPEELIIIDEIGKMECLSSIFRDTMVNILKSQNPIIATLPAKGTPFIESLKKTPDIISLSVTIQNRNILPQKIISLLENK